MVVQEVLQRDESLEDEEHSGWQSSKLILLQLHEKLPNVDHSMVIQHLKQIGKIKKLNKWVFHKLTENQKNRYEVSPSLIVLNNHEPFLDRIVMHKKWILYDNWQ